MLESQAVKMKSGTPCSAHSNLFLSAVSLEKVAVFFRVHMGHTYWHKDVMKEMTRIGKDVLPAQQQTGDSTY